MFVQFGSTSDGIQTHFSLKDEQVQLYANQHSFNVVESSLSNFSQVGDTQVVVFSVDPT